MIDVISLKSRLASREGDVQVKLGQARLTSNTVGTNGTLTYTHVQPTKMTQWIAAELIGIPDPGTDAIRIRLSDGDKKFYFDTTSGSEVTEVTDDTQWDTEYITPYLFGAALPKWTRKTLQVIIHLIATDTNTDPRVSDVKILMDHPTWEGAIAYAVRAIAEFVDGIEAVFIHSETLSASRGAWKVGNPHSEHQYNVTELVQVAIDNVHKSANLVDGEIILEGPAAQANQFVELAFKVKPGVTVRRTDEVRKVHRTPEWWLTDLVSDGGLTGKLPAISIAGQDVKERFVELRIRVNGVAHRQADALAMRIALQNAFANGLEITMPNGRCVFAQLDGLVEVVEEGALNLPMATGQISVSIYEYVGNTTFRNQLDENGDYIGTTIEALFPDDLSFTFDQDGFNC